MTARTGMTSLITRLRGMIEAGTADYAIAGQSYWTDDQLQGVLDDNRRDYNNYDMSAAGTIGAGGTIGYQIYLTGIENWESDPVIQDADWATAGTASYSFDARRGIVTFTADTEGASYKISGHAYNLQASAAEVWQQKAAHYSGSYDIKTDNHDLKRSQLYEHAKEMARTYAVKALGGSVLMERGDTRKV